MGIRANKTETDHSEPATRGYTYRYWAGVGAGILLGLIFIISGVGKLLYQGEFLIAILSGSFITPQLAYLVAQWLPWVEIVLGFLLLTGFALKIEASLSAVLIGAFIADNSWKLSQGLGYEPCGCFGILENLFMSTLSSTGALYMDIGMLALVLIVLLSYPESFLATRPWFLEEPRTGEDKGSM